MIRLDRHAWRLWIAGRRIHHGAVGMFLVGFGLVLAAHDWTDRREWFRGGK